VPSSLAGYIIREFPQSFVLPPGAVIELIRTVQRYHRIKERIELVREQSVDSESTARQGELLALEEQILRIVGKGSNEGDETMGSALSAGNTSMIAHFLENVNDGYSRLAALASEKLRSLPELFAGAETLLCSPEIEQLVSDLEAQLSARKPLYSSKPRSRSSNRCDALNMASVLALQGRGQNEFREKLQRRSYSHLLLTETRPIRELNVVDYGADLLADQLVQNGALLADELPDERIPWMVTNLSTAAVYCAFRSAYGTADAALAAARMQLVNFFGLTTELLRYAHSQRNQPENVGPVDLPSNIQQMMADVFSINGTIGKWYLPCRQFLQQAAYERQSLRPMAAISDFSSNDSTQIVNLPIHLQSTISSFALTSPRAISFESIGVSESIRHLGDVNETRELQICSKWTNEVLVKAQRWKGVSLVSIWWSVAIDFDKLAKDMSDWMNAHLVGVRGRLSATYECYTPDGAIESLSASTRLHDLPASAETRDYSRTIRDFSSNQTVAITDFVIAQPKLGSQMFLFPDVISIETEMGDVHFDSLFSADKTGPHAVCNIALTSDIFHFVGLVMPPTISWSGVPGFAQYCLQRVVAFCRE
jgi:hypothetical protein